MKDAIRRLYRMVIILSKDGLLDIDMGIPTYGEQKCIDEEVYEKLRSNGHILEKIAPFVLREKYLSNRDYVSTEQLYQSLFRTLGETRIDKIVLEQGINKGVRMGLFGLGELENNKPICRYFKELPTIAFSGNEVMISEALCHDQRKQDELTAQKTQLYTQPEIGGTPKHTEVSKEKDVLPYAKTREKYNSGFQCQKVRWQISWV